MMAKTRYPIEHWSYSSLVSYLRNPLAWYKRYVEKVYDTPGSPASFVGRAGHRALEHFYGGLPKAAAVALGLEYLNDVADFEIHFGKASSATARKKRRAQMKADYLRAIGYYLLRAPRHDVLGVEVKAVAHIPGVPLPVKAVSDLVVTSRIDRDAVDIIDHKFVDSFNRDGGDNPLFAIQALFNYYTVLTEFKRPVRRFIVYECKKQKNRNGRGQLRRYALDYLEHENEMRLFQKLIKDATDDLSKREVFLPNPTDMFEGRNSLDVYRLDL